MKKLTPRAKVGDIWFPEDGVDRRSALSLEGGFQALMDAALMRTLLRIGAPINLPGAGQVPWVEPPYLAVGTNQNIYNYNTLQATQSPYATNAYYATPSGRLWTANGNKIRYSDDWGQAWSAEITFSATTGGIVYLFMVSDDNQKVLVHYSADGKTYISTNGGAAWASYTPNPAWASPTSLFGRWWNGYWWVMDGSTLKRSADGINWTTLTVSGATLTNGIPYVRGNRLIIPATNAIVSHDGTQPTVETLAPFGLSASIAYLTRQEQPLFVWGGSGGNSLYITDEKGRLLIEVPGNSTSVWLRNGLLVNGLVLMD